MSRAGKVFFMVDPFQNTGLDPVLERWALGLGNDVIIDISPTGRRAGAGPEIPVVVDYLSHPITRDFRFATFFPVARTVSVKEKPPEGVSAQGLARTSGESWAETNQDQIRTGQVKPDPGEARGPLTIAAVATVDAKDAPADRKGAKARIVAGRRLGLRGERVRQPLRQPRLLPQHALVARRGGEPDRGPAQGVAERPGLPDRRPGAGRSSWCRWCSSR